MLNHDLDNDHDHAAYRRASLTDSAYDGSLAGDAPGPNVQSSEQQYSELGGAGVDGIAQQIAAKGGKGKLRSALSKMAHGVTGETQLLCMASSTYSDIATAACWSLMLMLFQGMVDHVPV